jgi:hypothetical protein
MAPRTPLVAYRRSVVTPDTAEALRQLEMRAEARGGVRVVYRGVSHEDAAWGADPGPTGYPSHLSMRPTGREVYISLDLLEDDRPEEEQRQDALEALWELTLPLGFDPWCRYPVASTGDAVFHFLGPWRGVYERLCAEGRGDLAWPSTCAAAQVDVGRWGGDRETERVVQAQLHRLGIHSGPVDGVIGERTTAGLRSFDLKGASLGEMASALCRFETPQTSSPGRRRGHVLLAGDDVSVMTYGKVASLATKSGAVLTVDGPGRVVINVG